MLMRQFKWLRDQTVKATRFFQGLWSELSQEWSRLASPSGPTEAGVTMTSSRSEPKSPECASSSTELRAEITCPEQNSIGPLQDSRIDSATSSGNSAPCPVNKTTIVDRHGTLALVLASAACGAIALAGMWLPYMLTASAAKADARAQQAVVTAELVKRDLEDLRRRVDLHEEKQKWRTQER